MGNFPFKPKVVGWELTLRCNMNCIHCGSSAGPPRPDELSLEEGLSLIDQLVNLGAEVVTLSGGEPSLHPHWDIYARRLLDAGVSTYMITNGLLLEKSIPRLLKSGLRRIGISLDGTEKTHNKIRNHPESFRIATQAAIKAKEAGISVGAVTHISRLNIGELEDMYRIFSEIPLSFWQIQITFKQGRMLDHEDFSLEPEEMLPIAQFIYEKQQIKGKLLITPGDNMGYYCNPPITKHPWKGCFAGRHLIGIDADGSIKGCLSLPREFVEGNIRQEPLRKIWEDPTRFRYNRYFNLEMLEGFCKGCPKGDPCRAGCTVTAYSATGSKFNNPYCVFRIQREREAGVQNECSKNIEAIY